MILGICDNPDVLEVMRIIDTVVTIIKIAVPIMLIISSMLNYMNAVKNNDNDALNKANKAFVSKIIAAIIVFMIPTLVKMIAKIASNNLEYARCIASANTEGISSAYYNYGNNYIDIAYKTFKESDYKIAFSYINKIRDETLKKELQDRLSNLDSYFKIKSLIDSKTDYNKIVSEINKLTDENIKDKLLQYLEKAYTGKPLNVAEGFYEKTGSGSINVYNVYIPSGATENMPVVVFMPGVDNMKYIVKMYKNSKIQKSKAILLIPNINYNGSQNKSLRNVIKSVVNEYKANDKRISITGFSTGGWYMYNFVAENKDLIAAIVSVSTGHTYNSGVIQNNLDYFRKIPMKGYGESTSGEYANGKKCAGWTTGWNAAGNMNNLFSGLGRKSDFTNLGAVCHSDTMYIVYDTDNDGDGKNDTIEWMISQSM